MDLINNYYHLYNFPSDKRLYKIMKRENVKVTLKEIQMFLRTQEDEEVLRPVMKIKKHTAHIHSDFPNEFWNIDIFDLSKYSKYNKGYAYIFCAIDIFTRIAFCVPMKTKSEKDVVNALSDIITNNEVMPISIVSDSDSTFTAKKFQAFLTKHEINHNIVPVGDHHSLGIIDRFALTLKRILTKHREIKKSFNWVDILTDVLRGYLYTEHTALKGLTPMEALKPENFDRIYQLNYDKSKKVKIVNDLEAGDKVRISEKNIFKKGSESQWSSEVYTVESARGLTVYLTDGKKKKRDMLLKVSKETISKENLDKKVTKEKKVKQLLKKRRNE